MAKKKKLQKSWPLNINCQCCEIVKRWKIRLENDPIPEGWEHILSLIIIEKKFTCINFKCL